jgi:hypothetical protein
MKFVFSYKAVVSAWEINIKAPFAWCCLAIIEKLLVKSEMRIDKVPWQVLDQITSQSSADS